MSVHASSRGAIPRVSCPGYRDRRHARGADDCRVAGDQGTSERDGRRCDQPVSTFRNGMEAFGFEDDLRRQIGGHEPARCQQAPGPAAESGLTADTAAPDGFSDLDQHQHRHVNGGLAALGALEDRPRPAPQFPPRPHGVPNQRVSIRDGDTHRRRRGAVADRRAGRALRAAGVHSILIARSDASRLRSSSLDVRLPASANGRSVRLSSSATRASR